MSKFTMPDQRSLLDQLEDLAKLAVEHKMYDAHDWLLANCPKPAQRAIGFKDDLDEHNAWLAKQKQQEETK